MTPLALFETPVCLFDIGAREAADVELARRLVAESMIAPGVAVSNRGGWHSTPDLALRPEPLLRELCGLLAAHVRLVTERLVAANGAATPAFGLGLTAWAMVMRDGDYTVLHDHPDATWSMAYYVDAGDADPAVHPDSGALVLVDPRRSVSAVQGLELYPTSFVVRPTTGMLVVFPGYLQHYVHAYRGTRPRVVVAANASLRVVPAITQP